MSKWLLCLEIEMASDKLYFGSETGYHEGNLAVYLFLGKMLHSKQEVLLVQVRSDLHKRDTDT